MKTTTRKSHRTLRHILWIAALLGAVLVGAWVAWRLGLV